MRIGNVSVGSTTQANVSSAMGVSALKKSQKINKDMAMQLINSVPKPKSVQSHKIDIKA